MAKEYREILRKYQRRQREIHPSYRDNPLYNYALENIVPYIWMDLGFADELVDVIFRTSDSIENKIKKIHREVQKIEDAVRQQSVFSLDRRTAFKKAMLIATSWAGKYPAILEKAGLNRSAEIARGLNTQIKFSSNLVDRKPMRDFATTWGAFDQFAYPPPIRYFT